jgi:hypothetical protein
LLIESLLRRSAAVGGAVHHADRPHGAKLSVTRA